jgi:hypothetical protein
MAYHHYDPTRKPGIGLSGAVVMIENKLQMQKATQIELRRAFPELTTTTIGKALNQLQKEGKVIDDGRNPKRYWIKKTENKPKNYEVTVSISYIVEVQAENEETARTKAEEVSIFDAVIDGCSIDDVREVA